MTTIPNMPSLNSLPTTAAQGYPFYQQLLNAQRALLKRGQVFIIMQFEGMDEVNLAIKEECSRIGLVARRADDVAGTGFVMSDIDLMIRESEFIICDLSNARANVYYELGYAHGAGNVRENTLLIARKRKRDRFPFDIQHLQVYTYESVSALRSILATQLGAFKRAPEESDFAPHNENLKQPNFALPQGVVFPAKS